MKIQYENNLRTHYSPIKRNRNCLTRNNSYGYKKYRDNNEYLPINTNPNLQEYSLINKPNINKYINEPCLNYHYKKKNFNINISEKEKLNKSFNKVCPFFFQDKVQLLEKEKKWK